ncbi:MAG: shikimate dehydrogenase [Actinobacteria bacterium]|nr:shikimate dehydrogenase [Actinomycetota bacterium]
MAGLPALGFAGANVTMPHKEGAARLADARTPEVDRIRAANTLVVGPDGVVAHNTDAPGFALFLSDDAGFDPAGRTALVFGAGGAARACAWALASGGLADLAVAVREPGRAGALVEALEGTGTEVRVLSLDRAPDLEADLVVNATPLGALGEVPPHPPFRPGMLVVDLLYSPAVTPLVARARAGGAAAFGGLGLLVHQAALSYTLWTGQRAPIEAMSAAAAAALPAPPGLAGA